MIVRITSYATVFTCLFLGGCIISGKTVATGDGLSVTAGLLGTQTTVSAGTGVGGVVEGVTGLVGTLGGDILYVAGNAPLLSQGGVDTAPLTTNTGQLVEVIAPTASGGDDAIAKAADTSVLTAYVPGDQGAESLRIAREAQPSLGTDAAATPGGGTSSGVGGAVGGAAGAVGSTVSTILGASGGGSGGLLGGLLP